MHPVRHSKVLFVKVQEPLPPSPNNSIVSYFLSCVSSNCPSPAATDSCIVIVEDLALDLNACLELGGATIG